MDKLLKPEDIQTVAKDYMQEIRKIDTSGFVAKEEGKSLATAAQLAQIETNKTDIAGLKTGKVDKVEGSGLATSAQLAQIETNRTAIAAINSDLSELAAFLDTYA